MTEKIKAGYRLLMILSAVDGKINEPSDKIIRQFLREQFASAIELEEELNAILQLQTIDHPVYFNDAMNTFYLLSDSKERTHLLDLAVKLVIEDHKITPRENLFLNELFNAWEVNPSI
jgi:hypothetical protein